MRKVGEGDIELKLSTNGTPQPEKRAQNDRKRRITKLDWGSGGRGFSCLEVGGSE